MFVAVQCLYNLITHQAHQHGDQMDDQPPSASSKVIDEKNLHDLVIGLRSSALVLLIACFKILSAVPIPGLVLLPKETKE